MVMVGTDDSSVQASSRPSVLTYLQSWLALFYVYQMNPVNSRNASIINIVMSIIMYYDMILYFFLQNFSLNSIAYIYLLVKFLFCLFFCLFSCLFATSYDE